MKLRSILMLALLLFCTPVHAQVNPGSLSPIVILAEGQSNFVMTPAFASTPNPNAVMWNNVVGTDGSVGTAYVPLSRTTISLPQKFASDVADANPGHPVCLITIAFTGQQISHWLVGTGAPDAYQNTLNNISAALTACNATKINTFLWWQGEADSVPLNATYVANFTTMINRFWGNSWFPQETPIVVFGICSVADCASVNANADQMNGVLQGVVNADPDKRRFVYTSSLHGSTYWNGSNLGHMTGQGYFSAGAMGSNAYLNGPGRNTVAQVITDPVTGFLTFGKPAVAGVPFLFNLGSVITPAAYGNLNLVGADAAGTFMGVSAFGNFSGYAGQRANGTQASPTVLNSSDLITFYNANGYNGTTFNNVGGLKFFAAEAWSGTQRGTYASITNTILGTNTEAEGFRSSYGQSSVFGDGSGTGAGTLVAGVNGGSTAWSIGNTSKILGGAYDPTLILSSGNGAYRINWTSTGMVLSSANGTLSTQALGTGVQTALGVNVGTAGSVIVNGGALGTPSSGNGSNLTNIPTTALTGALQAAQEPAHTGDMTNTAGSLATTVSKINGVDQTTAWSTYVPTIACNAGAITTLGSVTGRYKTIGKTVLFSVVIGITTVGTCTGFVTFTFPPGVTANATQGAAGKDAATGKMINAGWSSGATTGAVLFYDGTGPASSGAALIITGVLEQQ